MNIVLTILAFALGAAGGAVLAMYQGRPQRGGRVAPLTERLIPAVISVVLLGLGLWLLPGKASLFAASLLTAFCLVLIGTAIGLGKRDRQLIEMASVFRIPVTAGMQYIDLPACRTHLVRSAQAAGVVSALAGAAALILKGGENVFISQLLTGVVVTVLVTAADMVLGKKSGKAGGAV